MKSHKICMIGLGYVGLPLAVEFAKYFPVVGFDIRQSRIDDLNQGHDSTLEVDDENLQSVLKMQIPSAKGLFLSSKIEDIRDCNIYIVTVPTPVDKNNRPDLTPLIKSSETIGKVISKDDTSITVKGRDGSSKIVLYTPTTQVMKSTSGSSTDITVGSQVLVQGKTNSDGSVTAQNISIRPTMPKTDK